MIATALGQKSFKFTFIGDTVRSQMIHPPQTLPYLFVFHLGPLPPPEATLLCFQLMELPRLLYGAIRG